MRVVFGLYTEVGATFLHEKQEQAGWIKSIPVFSGWVSVNLKDTGKEKWERSTTGTRLNKI